MIFLVIIICYDMCLASFFFFFIAFLKLGSIILSVDWELLRLFWQVGVQNHKIGGENV